MAKMAYAVLLLLFHSLVSCSAKDMMSIINYDAEHGMMRSHATFTTKQGATSKLNEEQISAFTQMMMKNSESIHAQSSGDTTHGTLMYYTRSDKGATFYDSHNFIFGFGKFPDTIPPRTPSDPSAEATFVHHGNKGADSKAAVVYFGGDRYWLVAWHTAVNKVYVEELANGAIDWKAIEQKLDASNIGGSIYVPPGSNYATAMSTIANGNLRASFYNL